MNFLKSVVICLLGMGTVYAGQGSQPGIFKNLFGKKTNYKVVPARGAFDEDPINKPDSNFDLKSKVERQKLDTELVRNHVIDLVQFNGGKHLIEVLNKASENDLRAFAATSIMQQLNHVGC